MTDLVEAVARALCEADCGCVTDNELARCRDLARAVIPVVQAHERERCAKVAECAEVKIMWGAGRPNFELGRNAAAAAIRGLGEP